ncbi:XYL1 [Symbiodinium necroappetens]|uniref:XYL1 protein n=1 Tax=Symbiodinium necroappetens TaxID=1628268 RepID=A0A812VWE1_9DINO|nr:XYL1 [Symbiodinium necroappetens]
MAKLVAKDPHELTQFWSLTYHLNRFYARLHGYRFRRPDISNEALFEMLHDGLEPPRRVQWSIVRLIQQELEDRTCDFVVWMDSDAYIVSSEPLETVLVQNGLLNSSDPNSSRGRQLSQ